MADYNARTFLCLLLYFLSIAVDYCIMFDGMISTPTRSVLFGVKRGVLSILDFSNAGEHRIWFTSGVCCFFFCFYSLLSLERIFLLMS